LHNAGTGLALSGTSIRVKLLTPSLLMNSRLLRAAAAAFAILALPSVASAQIYSWRDANGGLVVSNRPKDAKVRTYAVSNALGFRATRPALTIHDALYDRLIDQHSVANGVSSDLVRAVVQAESAFNPFARSVKGAMGLMQLMPATAAEYGVVNAYDPAANVRAGVAYLKSLLVRYANDEELALAAYNAGPGAVEKYGSVPPYRETRAYVARVRRTAGSRTAPETQIFRTVEIKDGREIPRYSNTPPASTPAAPSGR
jgi:soluble lytic murein transglycosylase-like protein